MFWSYYVLKLLRLETIPFSDATISDINVVLCYVLSQYQFNVLEFAAKLLGGPPCYHIGSLVELLIPIGPLFQLR